MAVAPISDPQVVMLVTLYNPTGEGGHQGGGVAAPIGGQILAEVLPYLELKKDNESSEDKIEEVIVPEIRNMTITDAAKSLKEIGLGIEYNPETAVESVIKNQLPLPGIKVNKGSKIIIEI